MARSSNSTTPSSQVRRRSRTALWTSVGAFLASAAVGNGVALKADARLDNPAGSPALDATIQRVQAQLDPWESPQAVLADVNGDHTLAESDAVPLPLVDAPQTASPSRTYVFNIPAGPLDGALQLFQKITGITVTSPADIVQALSTGGASGTVTAEQALEKLLAGTALSHHFLTPTNVVVELRVSSQDVEVTGIATTVESPKYAGTLTETPQTIQVIPRALIDEQGATTLSEAMRNVPGITMQAGEGGGASSTTGDMFNMRGFSAANSLFVDGVRDDGLLARDVYNLEKIEVFSGPTGSDVGRTNAAGYINMTTKSPALTSLRNGTLTYGSANQVRGTVDINEPVPLGEGGTWLSKSAVRLNALWQDGGVPGRDFAGRESKSMAPSISFGLDTPTRVTVLGEVMRQNNTPDYGLPAAASPIGPLTAGAAVSATPVAQTNYYGSPDVDYDHIQQDSATLRVEHDFRPGTTLRNQTRYNQAERDALVTSIANAASYVPATNLVTLSRQANQRQNSILSNQTNLSTPFRFGGLQHTASIGLEVSRERQLSPTLTGVGTRAPIDLTHPDTSSPVTDVDIVPTGASTDGTTNTAAAYAFDTVDLNSRTRLTGGLRLERYSTRSRSVATTGVPTDLGADGTLVSGKAGLVYRLSSRGNAYVSYGSSLTPPGSANFQLNAAATNQNSPNLAPQQSINYEAGTKWDLAHERVQVSGAVFYTRNTNVIYVVDSTAVPPVFNQDDGQRVTGVDVSVVGRLTSRWEINASAQYLDSTVKSQNAATNGKQLALTPPKSASVWTTYQLAHDVRVGGGLRYIDRVYISTANTTTVPRYAVADALVEVPVSRRLTLRLNVYNLANKTYINSINNNGGRYNPGTPRSFLVGTAFRF